MLRDTFWADADNDDLETLARRLAKAMEAHLEGRDADAAREASEVQEAAGEPAHAERLGDVGAAAVDEVAERVWDVFAALSGVWRGGGNMRDVDDPQRRLRWALERLPDRVRGGLPLVEWFASADWDELFGVGERSDVEPDIREEMRSVRTQVAQGLPVTRRWIIETDHGEVSAGSRDAVAYLWEVRRGDETRRIQVFISGTAMAVENAFLPREVAEAKESHGRSVVITLVALDDPPDKVLATTAGISLTLPD